jgi:hypothetical protein
MASKIMKKPTAKKQEKKKEAGIAKAKAKKRKEQQQKAERKRLDRLRAERAKNTLKEEEPEMCTPALPYKYYAQGNPEWQPQQTWMNHAHAFRKYRPRSVSEPKDFGYPKYCS